MTRNQLETVRTMTEYCQNFADQILQIMKNSGMDLIEGTRMTIDVRPDMQFTTRHIMFGTRGKASGYYCMAKGYSDEKFTLYGDNSAEYERLFADPAVLELLQEAETTEKPLPPDGLWISIYDDPPVLDSGRDINAEVPETH